MCRFDMNIERIFKTVLGEDEWQMHLAREQAFKEDCAKFESMTDAQLAEAASYFLRHCERPRWDRGEPVYDGIMAHNIIPEMIKRLRD